MATAIREPAVAGRFYPANPQTLHDEIESYIKPADKNQPEQKINALGCIVPHAGYMYSGHVAGAVYRRLDLPEQIVILCPNHTGMGEPLAIMSEGVWRTPLGDAAIDEPLAAELKQAMPLLSEDEEAHRAEHALEVQLPFLQVLEPDFRFVPITVGTSNFSVLSALGTAIGNVLTKRENRVLVIASSDMNHYESDEVTRVKDHRAIDQLLALDPRGLYDVVREGHISMCGYGPAVIMLTAACKLGATKAELIRYATSGDISGDKEMVVGYAGIAVF
ncbi:MAG TPA: AmmeMemoRadiSam system protein B [Verrucomicrobiae bacterium]|jgi:AmmeMemoRadiSam system protein B|nr:AmmeMemoRadiSam system protein B [Verrucomicrobiae bacterium]